jgi:hypothetical protein
MTYIDASEALAQKALTWPERAAGLVITSQEGYELAGSYLRGIKELRAEVEAHHRPIIASAFETHKRAVAALRSIDDPLSKAEAIIKPKVAAYDAEQRRIADEARRKAEAEQERLQAEWLESRIERAEAAGATAAEVAAIIEQPMIVPQARPAVSNHQPVQGVSVRERYVARVTNIRELCRAIADGRASTELVLPNMPALNKMASAMRTTFTVPGCQVVRDDSVSVRRGLA